MKFPYEDIVQLPHPVSPRRSRMSGADRAAQFSPFAALSGHEDAVAETARLTDTRAQLDENEQALLNEKFQDLHRRLDERPLVSVLCFTQDPLKDGGAYVTITGRVKKIDTTAQLLILDTGDCLGLGDIYGIC